MDLLICGHIYTVDLDEKVQFRKDGSGKRRRIRNDVDERNECKGVAGLIVKQ